MATMKWRNQETGIFKGLIGYNAALDSVLNGHLENSTKGQAVTVR